MATLRIRHFIDSYKVFTAIFIFYMMVHYDKWENRTLWIYLATHGVYCILWIHKSISFGDKNWEEPSVFRYSMYADIFALGVSWDLQVLPSPPARQTFGFEGDDGDDGAYLKHQEHWRGWF